MKTSEDPPVVPHRAVGTRKCLLLSKGALTALRPSFDIESSGRSQNHKNNNVN